MINKPDRHEMSEPERLVNTDTESALALKPKTANNVSVISWLPLLLIIALVITFLIYKGVGTGSDESIPGSSPATAIIVPCGQQEKDMTFEEMGARGWADQHMACFVLAPGCTSPIIPIPNYCRGWGRAWTLVIGPVSGSYTSRYQMPNGNWSEWHTVSRTVGRSIPVDATARQWRNNGENQVIIISRLERR